MCKLLSGAQVKMQTIFLFTCFLLTGCISQRVARVRENYTKVPETTKHVDIPIYKEPHLLAGLPFNYWHYTKQKEGQLHLSNPEIFETGRIFRVWITNPAGFRNQPHGLINITCETGSDLCNGELIFMRVDFDSRNLTETITTTNRIELSPNKLTWGEITDSLLQLKFHELPTDEEIPGYYGPNAGYANMKPTFSFEYSSPEEYRFYQYNDIYRVPDEFWQAGNVIKILDLLEEEFQWSTCGFEYFSE